MLPRDPMIDAPTFTPKLRMDNWTRAVSELVLSAASAVTAHGEAIAKMFLGSETDQYIPLPVQE